MRPHAMAMEGTHSQPGHAKRPGINTQAAEMALIRNATFAFEDRTHSWSDGAKAPIAIHIRILVL